MSEVVDSEGRQLVLQECACGEPLLDDVRRCPRCGTPNPAYRRPRWRIFWPDIDTLPGTDDAIQLGYWAAFFAAALGAVMSLVRGASGLAGLVDAGVFAVLGLGIWRRFRVAALLAFLLILANVVISVSRGGGVGVLALFIFVGLLNGVRGTFARARLSKKATMEAAG